MPDHLTRNVTGADVVVFPAVSEATAVNVCDPFDAAVQTVLNGAVVTGLPKLEPSSLYCTLVTATLSAALTLSVNCDLKLTVWPAVGDVILTVGGCVSAMMHGLELVHGGYIVARFRICEALR